MRRSGPGTGITYQALAGTKADHCSGYGRIDHGSVPSLGFDGLAQGGRPLLHAREPRFERAPRALVER